jgi:hypothetical protein
MIYCKMPINRKLYRQISVFICVHLRLISVSLSDRTRKIKFELFSKINEKGLTESPQSTQRPSMSVSRYKMAAASRIRTRMTRIARIFTDTCALLKVHFFEFIQLERNSKILETLNNLYITPRLFNSVRLKKLAVE